MIQSTSRGRLVLLSVVIGFGLGIIIYGTIVLTRSYRDGEKLENIPNIVVKINQSFVEWFKNDRFWLKTIEANPSLSCLKADSKTSCESTSHSGQRAGLVLYNATGVMAFDPGVQGFTIEGGLCRKEDPLCRIQLKLWAELECPENQKECPKPKTVNIRAEYSDVFLANGTTIPLRDERFQLNIRKDWQKELLDLAKKEKEPSLTPSEGGRGVSGTTSLGSLPSLQQTGGAFFAFKCPFFMPGNGQKPPVGGIGCIPLECPQGFQNLGVTSEAVSIAPLPKAGDMLFAFNAVRWCSK